MQPWVLCIRVIVIIYPHPIQGCNGSVQEALLQEHEVRLQQLRLQAVAGDDGGLHHVVHQRARDQQHLQR